MTLLLGVHFFVGFSDRLEDEVNIIGHAYHEISRADLLVQLERN